MLGILETTGPSELVSKSYISKHNKMRRPRPKFKVSFYLYFCCFWINFTQINFENIKRKIQSCFQLKSWFNVDTRAPSIPLLNFPFKWFKSSVCFFFFFFLWSWKLAFLVKVKVYLYPENIFLYVKGTQIRSPLHQHSVKNIHQVIK